MTKKLNPDSAGRREDEEYADGFNAGHDEAWRAVEQFRDWLKGERIPAGTMNPEYRDTIADNTINRVQVKFDALFPTEGQS